MFVIVTSLTVKGSSGHIYYSYFFGIVKGSSGHVCYSYFFGNKGIQWTCLLLLLLW